MVGVTAELRALLKVDEMAEMMAALKVLVKVEMMAALKVVVTAASRDVQMVGKRVH